MQEPLIHRTQNPLIWWQERKAIYPMLYKLVKRRLCIVATSVPCERLFSKAGQIVTEKKEQFAFYKNFSNFIFMAQFRLSYICKYSKISLLPTSIFFFINFFMFLYL